VKVPICLVALLATTPLYAAPRPIEEVVITATRLSIAPENLGSAVTVITKADLDRLQSPSVAAALRTVPGVTITEGGAFGGATGVKIRGMLSEQTLILIDGVVINDPSSPGAAADIARLAISSVERIEVLRGAQSPIYGSAAMGGIVNIITRSAKGGYGGEASVEGGSFGTVRGQVSVHGGTDKVQANITLGASDTDGISKADARDGNPEADGYSDRLAAAKLRLTPSDAVAITLYGRTQVANTDFDGSDPSPPYGLTDSDAGNRTEESLLGFEAHITAAPGTHITLNANRSLIARDDDDAGVPTFWADGVRDAVRLDVDGKAGAHSWLVGLEHVQQSFETQYDAPASQTTISAYAQTVLRLGALSLNLGGRVDDTSAFGTATTGRIGAVYALSDALRLRASYGTGFKTPSLFQSTFYCCGATGPNVDLVPEHNRSADLGFDWTGSRTTLGGQVFWQTARDLIDFDYFAGGYVNISATRNLGVELFGSYQVSEDWTLRASATALDAQNTDTGTRLDRVPHYAGTVSVDYTPNDRMHLGADLRLRTPLTDTSGTAGGYGIVTLRGGYNIGQNTELYARIENLFDSPYQEVFGYGTPGRSAYIGVRQRW
jgi:vitamin B12 transporter